MNEPDRRMVYPPTPWSNPVLRLYHGTTAEFAREIVRSGALVARGRDERDFGRGFYTTTNPRQAKTWAYEVAGNRGSKRAAVVRFDVDRELLAPLETLAFVRGDFDASDYWSFVVHCRGGAADHGRISRAGGLYDVVVGPVVAFWTQRLAIWGSDQISFHTAAAEAALNSSSRAITWTASH